MLLAIDTATQVTSIAVFDGRNLRFEQTWETERHHSTELAPSIRRAFEHIGASMSEMTGLAVCVGPGTYTGLRIGVSLAKGLALARQLPLVGLTTTDILAAGQPQAVGTLVTVVRAGRGRIITAAYNWQGQGWQQQSEPDITDWGTLLEHLDEPATITGEVDEEGHASVQAARARGRGILLSPPALRLRRAGYLAQEAWARLETERSNYSPALVVPVYIKTKDSP